MSDLSTRPLLVADGSGSLLNHRVFRYPAKFHPPIARALINEYSSEGETLFDPFSGSGTLLVEALTMKRNAIGTDIDPVAVEVSWAKTCEIAPDILSAAIRDLKNAISSHEREGSFYASSRDLSQAEWDEQVEALGTAMPRVPNADHWFRRYVMVDLAVINREISLLAIPDELRRFLRTVLGSIIRAASNADPVPVSGLEVTSHMRKLEAKGRVVNAFALMEKALKKFEKGHREFVNARSANVSCTTTQADASNLPASVPVVDSIITSPPYNNAVDYYRRHTLEMYWMGLVADHSERLALLPKYIGRPRIAASNPVLASWEPTTGLVARWSSDIHEVSAERGRDFDHYMGSMSRCFAEFGSRLRSGGTMVLVVGKSSWNGGQIPTDSLFEELVGDEFDHVESRFYPIKNRSMSYARRNGANISSEEVMVFRRH